MFSSALCMRRHTRRTSRRLTNFVSWNRHWAARVASLDGPHWLSCSDSCSLLTPQVSRRSIPFVPSNYHDKVSPEFEKTNNRMSGWLLLSRAIWYLYTHIHTECALSVKSRERSRWGRTWKEGRKYLSSVAFFSRSAEIHFLSESCCRLIWNGWRNRSISYQGKPRRGVFEDCVPILRECKEAFWLDRGQVRSDWRWWRR